TMLSLITRFKF
ncbi:putative membrane protein, partial [Chlamydia psittaci 84-8471/1]